MFVNDGSGGSFRAGPLDSGISLAKTASFLLLVTEIAALLTVETGNPLTASCDIRLITGWIVSAEGVVVEGVVVVLDSLLVDGCWVVESVFCNVPSVLSTTAVSAITSSSLRFHLLR